jgi:hypothetical protein
MMKMRTQTVAAAVDVAVGVGAKVPRTKMVNSLMVRQRLKMLIPLLKTLMTLPTVRMRSRKVHAAAAAAGVDAESLGRILVKFLPSPTILPTILQLKR